MTRRRHVSLAAGLMVMAAGPCAAVVAGCSSRSRAIEAPGAREAARGDAPVLADALLCDGRWHDIGGEWSEQCRCWPLAANEPAPNGATMAQTIARFNEQPPLTLASDDGLLQRVGLRSGGCGQETATFRFVEAEPAEPAEYHECRSPFEAARAASGRLKLPGQLLVTLQGRTLRASGDLLAADGTFTFHGDAPEVPLSLAGLWNAQSSSVIASPQGRPQPTISWSSSARPAADVAARAMASFGQPLERVLSELIVDSTSCKLDDGAVGRSEMIAPVAIQLESLVHAPCSARGSLIRLRVSADSFRQARAEGHASWAVSRNEPAAVVPQAEGDGASLSVDASTEEIAAPAVVQEFVRCAAAERLSAALSLSAFREVDRVRVRLTLTWSPRCEDASVSCEIEAHALLGAGG